MVTRQVEVESASTDPNSEAQQQAEILSKSTHEVASGDQNGSQEQESDGEARERPVRKQLEKTTINRTGAEGDGLESTSETAHLREESPGKESRKRSFEEARAESGEGASEQTVHKHQRHDTSTGEESTAPKNQSSTPPPTANNNTDNGLETQLSPQNKRSRDAFLASQEAPSLGMAKAVEATKSLDNSILSNDANKAGTDDEPTRKRHRDSPPLQSAFTADNQDKKAESLDSTNSKDGLRATSPAKFAASGFAALSGSASPFGSIGGNSTSSPFSALGSSKPSDKPSLGSTSSGFASAGGGFGSLSGQASGFGSLGGSSFSAGPGSASPFAAKGGAAPLSSFASGKGNFGATASKPVKPIGASNDADEVSASGEDEDGEENTEKEETPVPESDEQDDRFYEQDVETGEESEQTVFTARAKLYMTVDKQWKERGHGVFKVNARNVDGSKFRTVDFDCDGPKVLARFLMRADGSHRLALNSPIKKELKVQDPSGGHPKGNTAVFLGWIDDKPTLLQVKLRNNQIVDDFHRMVVQLQGRM